MSAECENLCSHCFLTVGPRPMLRVVNGKSCAFCCYGCCIAFQVKSGMSEESDAAWILIRLGVGGFLSMNIMLFSILLYTDAFTGADAHVLPKMEFLLCILATPTVIILGGPFFAETWFNAIQGRLTSSALIAVGVAAAYIYSVFAIIEQSARVYFDTASMVLMLFTAGRYLEAVGRARAARDIEPLLAAGNECAIVLDNGVETRRAARDIDAGMHILVRPGERIAVDGVILDGCSHTDESVITGESRHIEKGIGSSVIAGSINLDGPLLIQSSGPGNATRWAQICRSVREALSHRTPTQRIADHVVTVSVPLVLILSLLTVLCWMQFLPSDQALLAGLAVLVVACPCAVGLAAPLATSIGIGRLARSGCLVRDPGALEALAQTRALAFDKTGTLTSGKAHVVGVKTDGSTADEVLARAAGLEFYSEHSFARAIMSAAASRRLESVTAHAVRIVPGRGLRGSCNGQAAAAGNRAFMDDLGWPCTPALSAHAQSQEAAGHSLVYVGWDDRVHALLSLDDSPLQEAVSTIEALRRRGLNISLLTGDHTGAAQRIAAAIGIENVESNLSPEAKRTALQQYARHHGVVAMVGDGLNDAPVLADADVGIAIGSATDLARQTAAIVLPMDGLRLLPWVIDIARAVRRTIISNLIWAFGYNLIALSLAALGLLQPVLAAAFMAGSSILVVLNSLRLERLPDPVSLTPAQEQKSSAEAEKAGGFDPESLTVNSEAQPV